MEAFSLLKYWRAGGGGGGGDATAPAATLATTDTNSTAAAAAAAILTAVAQNDDVEETDDDGDSDNEDDDGPFFDLEFTLPDDSEDSPQNLIEEDHTGSDSDNHSDEQENINNNNNDNSSEDSEGEGEREIKFTLSPSTSSNDRSDPNLSDDVVFKGELVQLEPSSFVLNSNSSSEPDPKPQFTARASLLKSATKFRVFMLGLKKPNKPNNVSAASEKDPNGPDPGAPNPKQQRKLFTVKFKVEEVPIMSLLFTRSDNSSRGGKGASSSGAAAAAAAAASAKSKEDSQAQTQSQSSHSASASEEKRLMRKYLRMVKPLYVKVSRRYAEKLRFSGQLNMTASAPAPAPTAEKEKEGDNIAAAASEAAGTNGKGQKQGNLPLPAGLRVVCKHLGKSRSASSVAAPAPASAPDPPGLVSSKRRDDSLLQQQDGIQGAILHCKRSFNASRDQCESSQLPRSVSDPLHEVSPELSRKSTNEGNDKRP